MKQKNKVLQNENVRELMNSMNNPEDVRLKTVKKYGVLLGKITGSEELSSEDKAKLIDKLIKKSDIHLEKVNKTLKRDDDFSKVLEYTEFAFPIGIAAAGIGLVSAILITAIGNDGLISQELAKKISDCLFAGSAAAVVSGLGVSLSEIPSNIVNEVMTTKHFMEKTTLEKIQSTLKTTKEALLMESGNFVTSENEV